MRGTLPIKIDLHGIREDRIIEVVHPGRPGNVIFLAHLNAVEFDIIHDLPTAGRRRISTQKLVDCSVHLHVAFRSEEHTSELQSLMRISYAVFCLKKKTKRKNTKNQHL